MSQKPQKRDSAARRARTAPREAFPEAATEGRAEVKHGTRRMNIEQWVCPVCGIATPMSEWMLKDAHARCPNCLRCPPIIAIDKAHQMKDGKCVCGCPHSAKPEAARSVDAE